MEPNKQSYRVHKRAEIAERRARVSDLYLKHNWTVYAIAKELSCGVATVSEDMAALRAEWKRVANLAVVDHIAVMLKKLDEDERRALEGFERSRIVKRVATVSKKTDALGEATVASATQIERDEGDVKFLVLLAKIRDQRMKLLGLDAGRGPAESEAARPRNLEEFIAAQLKQRELERQRDNSQGNGASAA